LNNLRLAGTRLKLVTTALPKRVSIDYVALNVKLKKESF